MEQFELTAVELKGINHAYILESESIDKLLINPGRMLLGHARQEQAFISTITWLRAMQRAGYFPEQSRHLCTVTVLAEGIGHNLPGALATVLGDSNHKGDNWIGVSRFSQPDVAGAAYTDFDAKVNYVRLHSVAPVWCMLDTIATGATLVRGIEAAFNNAEKPQRILLATPAGSHVGMRKIAELCQREGVELIATFFGAAFGLWHDGTGLPWCHPQTILAGTARGSENLKKAKEIFNDLPGFCSVGDCSANFFDVEDARRVLEEEQVRFNWRLPHQASQRKHCP
jgi:hypothetical protein